jgi:hypothetical protein
MLRRGETRSKSNKIDQNHRTFWNIRGPDKIGRFKCLAAFIKNHRLDFVGIRETRSKSNKIDQNHRTFWNIRGPDKIGRFKCLAAFIKNHRLDFVGIQETKKSDFPGDSLKSIIAI